MCGVGEGWVVSERAPLDRHEREGVKPLLLLVRLHGGHADQAADMSASTSLAEGRPLIELALPPAEMVPGPHHRGKLGDRLGAHLREVGVGEQIRWQPAVRDLALESAWPLLRQKEVDADVRGQRGLRAERSGRIRGEPTTVTRVGAGDEGDLEPCAGVGGVPQAAACILHPLASPELTVQSLDAASAKEDNVRCQLATITDTIHQCGDRFAGRRGT